MHSGALNRRKAVNGRSTTPRWCGVAAGVTLCLLIAVAAARGQDEYRLEDGGWQQVTQHGPDSPEAQLNEIRRAIAQDRPGRAEDLADEWIDKNGGHPALVEAYLLRGDARAADKRYYKALYDYEQVIRVYPASEHYLTALEREYDIAKLFASGTRRHFLGMRILSAAGEAEELFIRTQERAPGSTVAELASLALGDFYFDRKEMSSAAEAYDLFLTNYPQSRYRARAMRKAIRANLNMFRGPRYDPTGLLEAGQRIKAYRAQFPAEAAKMNVDPILTEIDLSLAVKRLSTARWYERRGEELSAIYLYRDILRKHPGTEPAKEASDRLSDLGAPPVAAKNP